MLLEGLFEGGLGKTLLVGLGVLAGAIIALLSRLGTRKAKDVKDKTGGLL